VILWFRASGSKAGIVPRYFFHIALGQTYIHDHHGSEYLDDAAARRHAIEDIEAIWQARTIRRQDPAKCAVVVSRQGGGEMFRVPFTEAPSVKRAAI
jgi:hypothetical protein